jgi:ribosome biogenesis protein MAK21
LKGLTKRGKGKATGRGDRLKAARAIMAIMDWWVGGGAPNQKLKCVSLSSALCVLSTSQSRYFRDQPLLHPDVTDQHIVVWYFEDWLKNYFFSYIQILEVSKPSPFSPDAHRSPGVFP